MKLFEVKWTPAICAAVVAAGFFLSSLCQAAECPSESTKRFYPSFEGPSSFVDCLNGLMVMNYSCGEMVFRPRTSENDTSPLCVSKSSKYGRAAFDCSNGSYSGDPTLYVTCQGGVPTDLFECPMGQYYIKAQSQCNYTCEVQYKEGSFPSADGYYTCTFNWATLRWNLTEHQCPDGQTFNPTFQFCLAQSDAPVE